MRVFENSLTWRSSSTVIASTFFTRQRVGGQVKLQDLFDCSTLTQCAEFPHFIISDGNDRLKMAGVCNIAQDTKAKTGPKIARFIWLSTTHLMSTSQCHFIAEFRWRWKAKLGCVCNDRESNRHARKNCKIDLIVHLCVFSITFCSLSVLPSGSFHIVHLPDI